MRHYYCGEVLLERLSRWFSDGFSAFMEWNIEIDSFLTKFLSDYTPTIFVVLVFTLCAGCISSIFHPRECGNTILASSFKLFLCIVALMVVYEINLLNP